MRTSKGRLAREIKDNLYHRWVEAKQKLHAEYMEAYENWADLVRQLETAQASGDEVESRQDQKNEIIAKAHAEGAAVYKQLQRPYVAREWL